MKRDQERKGMGQEDFLNYGNWNKAMKKLDYKMKKITPLLKKSSKDNANMKVFEPLSQRINKPIK